MPSWVSKGRPKAMIEAFEHCVGAHRDDARWIAFLDVDEFLFSPTGTVLPELLPTYERFPGVVVDRAEFGSSGHTAKPHGLVIENYVERKELLPDDRASTRPSSIRLGRPDAGARTNSSTRRAFRWTRRCLP